MPLESLLTLVEKLRERIDEHRDDLSKNEALTRYALIDPLLRELGWDTADPDLVIPEYKVSGRWADYALLNNGKPTMMVEAKSLESPLQDALSQGIGYCLEQGTPYFSVTDGRRWEIYETYKAVPIAEKRIVQFDLKDGPAAEECLKTLALWRPNVDSGRIAPGPAPLTPNQPDSSGSLNPTPQPVSSPDESEPEWQPISKLSPRKGAPSPREVQFPDGSTCSVKAWRWLIVEVTRWLVDGNYLTANNCPIQKPGSGFYVVSSNPIHPDGRKFAGPQSVGSLYVERFSGRAAIVAARGVIESAGRDPAQFKVRFS